MIRQSDSVRSIAESPASQTDFEPSLDQFREEIIHGLSLPEKETPCKYLYDERGSQIFDAICEVDEYYPTRTEMKIMREYGAEMVEPLGGNCLLIEYGSGSSTKTPILLNHFRDLVGYVPIDISREHLMKAAERLQKSYPDLPIYPVCADYTQRFDLPELDLPVSRRVVYFPGSTIGNFHPSEACAFLARIADVCDEGGGLLLGVDIRKSPDVLEAAYNDSQGVTAAFNLNLLERINRELGADFDVSQFEHRAIYNQERSRIEMRLFSKQRQSVNISGTTISFEPGESILTECSYKYGYDDFAELAELAGFQVDTVWTDDDELFSVRYLTAL